MIDDKLLQALEKTYDAVPNAMKKKHLVIILSNDWGVKKSKIGCFTFKKIQMIVEDSLNKKTIIIGEYSNYKFSKGQRILKDFLQDINI